MRLLLETALALFAGLMMTRVFKYLKMNFPDVTAFLIAGVLVGPYALGRLGIHGVGFNTVEDVESVSILSNVALGFIAFDIGNEFRLAHLKQTGKTATVIGIIQAVLAALMVDAVLIILHLILGPEVLPLPVAITLGAIASATAPAATLMVVRQYKAKGPVTDLLLPIVALDDAVGLVVFSVSFGIAQAMVGGRLDAVSVIVNPLLEKTENEKAMQEVGQRLLQLSQSAMKQQAYNDWHIVINESLVRAAVIVYFYENGFNQFVSSMLNVETMQNGFPWMLDVVSALRYYSTHREQYPTLNDFYPEIARFLSK
jgi:hypothetical protein